MTDKYSTKSPEKQVDAAAEPAAGHGVSEKALNLFYDQELEGNEYLRIKRELERGSDSLRRELDKLKEVRSELRAWTKQQMLDEKGIPISLDLWSKIESRLDEENIGGTIRVKRSAVRWRSLWTGSLAWLEQMREELHDAWNRPSLWAPAGAALVLAFFVGAYWGSYRQNMLPAASYQQLSFNDGPRNEAPNWLSPNVSQQLSTSRRAPQLLAVVGDSQEAEQLQAALTFPLNHEQSQEANGTGPSEFDQLAAFDQNSDEQSSDSWQLVKIGPVPGGLRAGNLDIDWIKANGRVKILSPQDPNKTPVIWLTKNAD